MRILVALFISIVLHLLAFFYLNYQKKEIQELTKEKTSKTKLHYVKLQKPKAQTKQDTKENKKPQSQPIQQAPVKPTKLPKIIEIPPVPKETKVFELPPKIEIPKPQIEKPKELKNDIKPQPKKVETPQESKPKESQKTLFENVDKITKSYLELYKDDFDTFAPETKVFLIKNLKDIGKITERFLIYPHLSIQAHQSGINVVEFTLFPNGKISEPKILKSSKYYILDDNSIETINTAYRDYPRPDKPTIIRIYVKYELI